MRKVIVAYGTDRLAMRQKIAQALSAEFEVLECMDADSALAAIEQGIKDGNPPAALMTEQNMLDSKGRELGEVVFHEPRYNHIAVIAATAHASPRRHPQEQNKPPVNAAQMIEAVKKTIAAMPRKPHESSAQIIGDILGLAEDEGEPRRTGSADNPNPFPYPLKPKPEKKRKPWEQDPDSWKSR